MRAEFSTQLRALLIALGLYAAGALVWFVGPLVQIGGVAPLASDRARVVAIAGVVLLFVLHLAWRALSSARRNRRLLDGLMPAAAARAEAAAPGAPEVAVIGQRFAQAVQVLRSRRVGKKSALGWLGRRPFVYQLPWYVIIGAPGAGKTTTIVNSGLEFPFATELGPKALRGAGGTRNCDWWFTSDAVLIDTAGRYTTQDSYREADRAAWFGFLQLLIKHRPRQPINGVILTLSATDLLQPDADRKRVLAREMRERLGELHSQLGIRFPIYVMVTKCDLLAGFAEFFADFDKDERAQVWGTTLPLDVVKASASAAASAKPTKGAAAPAESDSAARLARLSAELVALEKSLHDCLVARLHDERDRDRRAALFGFPQQWRVLREALADMLRMTFESSADGTTPLLRGVYFTSATQEGSPMDRALGALSRALGLAHRVLPPGRGSGRSYFVTRLLREVVLGESGLAGANRRWERQRAWLHGGVVVASSLLTVLALAWAWGLYSDNKDLLDTTAPAVSQLQAQASTARADGVSLATMVPLLDGLWTLTRDSNARTRHGAMGLGLEQGANLAAAAQDAYHHVLREGLVPRLAKRLEQRLGASGADAMFARYEALKAYLMLFGGTRFDATALRSYLLADWDADAAQVGSAAARKSLREHVDRLLASGEVGAPSMADTNLVAQTRAQLATAAPAQRVLARLHQGDATQGTVPLSIEPAALASAQKVLTRASGVPLDSGVGPLYTRSAQAALKTKVQEGVRQLEDESSWVLGTPPAAVDAAARARLIDAIESQLAVERLRAWDALVFDLRLLPTSSLATAAEQARSMSRPDSPLNAWLTALLRDMGPTPSGLPAGVAQSVEADRLNALRAYVMGTPAGYEPVHAAAGRIAAQLAAIDDASTRKAAAPAADAWADFGAAAARAPEPLRTLWQQMGDADAALALTTLRELWGQQLAGEVAPACARAVDGRYPFARQATQEITREEFVRTFASGGVIDGFFQRHLAGWIDTTTRPWGVRGAPQAKWGDALLPFQRAQAIRSAFFIDGTRQFGVRIDLRLLELDPGLGHLTIDVDGHVVRLARDARSAQTLQWPGPGGAGRIQLLAGAPGGGAGARFTFDGTWSLLRMFERVRVEPGASANRVVLVFDVEGRRARVEAQSPQGALAITMPELEQFQCPRRL